MNKNVLISIIGIQRERGDLDEEGQNNEPIEIITPATYFCKDGVHYVFFEEMQEGISEVTKNKIVYHPDHKLEVIKKGALNSEMIFDYHEAHESIYETAYGVMQMGIDTHSIRGEIEENKISIDIKYSLIVNGEAYAECEIRIKVW